MNNLTISIFGNRIFSEILQEVNLFSKYTNDEDKLVILFSPKLNSDDHIKKKKNNFPLLLIYTSKVGKALLPSNFEKIASPFSIYDLYKKIIFLSSKYQFKKNSLINFVP